MYVQESMNAIKPHQHSTLSIFITFCECIQEWKLHGDIGKNGKLTLKYYINIYNLY